MLRLCVGQLRPKSCFQATPRGGRRVRLRRPWGCPCLECNEHITGRSFRFNALSTGWRNGGLDELMDLLDGILAALIALVVHIALGLQDLEHGDLLGITVRECNYTFLLQ